MKDKIKRVFNNSRVSNRNQAQNSALNLTTELSNNQAQLIQNEGNTSRTQAQDAGKLEGLSRLDQYIQQVKGEKVRKENEIRSNKTSQLGRREKPARGE